jgi:hypothetical protein
MVHRENTDLTFVHYFDGRKRCNLGPDRNTYGWIPLISGVSDVSRAPLRSRLFVGGMFVQKAGFRQRYSEMEIVM